MRFSTEQFAASMSRISGPLAVALLVALALWPALRRPVKADERADSPLPLVYASPLEVLLSPDGARLYVLCQQTEEVRVLDARTYASVKVISVGHVPRGMALSSSGDRLLVTNSWDDTLSVIDTSTLTVIATWNVARSLPALSKIVPAIRSSSQIEFRTTSPFWMRTRALK